MTIEELQENVFRVFFNEKLVVTAGFNVISLITQKHFVWIELHSLPTRKQLVALKRVFDELCGISLFCNVLRSNRKAMRTAEFFGFRRVEENATIVIYERNV